MLVGIFDIPYLSLIKKKKRKKEKKKKGPELYEWSHPSPHSEHRFPAPFVPTLPDLVTSLKGHSLFPRSCPPMRSAPSESFGY